MRGRADKTRDKMRRGGLPAPFPAKAWRGNGSGDICSGCGDVIARADVQVDVDVHGALTLTFHEACYETWSKFPEAP